MTKKVNPIYSQPNPDNSVALEGIFSPSSKDIHLAVLTCTPNEFQHVSQFAKLAIEKLSLIPTNVDFDKPCHVIHILSALCEAGLVVSRQYELREEHTGRLAGSHTEYRITEQGRSKLKEFG